MLAAAGWLFGDLFLSGRVISVIAAITNLASMWAIARARLRTPAAAWLVALVAVNPSFVRYGYSVGNAPISAVGLDINHDGHCDLLVAREQTDSVSILLGNGAGEFFPAGSVPSGHQGMFITTGDFNADGIRDAVVACTDSMAILMG